MFVTILYLVLLIKSQQPDSPLSSRSPPSLSIFNLMSKGSKTQFVILLRFASLSCYFKVSPPYGGMLSSRISLSSREAFIHFSDTGLPPSDKYFISLLLHSTPASSCSAVLSLCRVPRVYSDSAPFDVIPNSLTLSLWHIS